MYPGGHHAGKGFTLLETIIGLAVFAIVSTGVLMGYRSVLEIIQSAQYNSASLSIIESQIELVRNMRYEDVGTVGGVPAGKIPPVQDILLDEVPYELHTFISNIDDPFDGTLGGNPADTAAADYKLVEFQVICDECGRYELTKLTTYLAPKNLESASKGGSLLISVFDADGQPVSGAAVRVTNPSASPAINLTVNTNVSGQLSLVNTATGSATYRIEVSKSGYSSDRTYPPGAPVNPVKPDATVATQQLTLVSLAIDRVSSITVSAHDAYCAALADMDFLLTGSTLIGSLPDVPRYSQNHTVSGTGTLAINSLAWDAYTFTPTDATYDIAGSSAAPLLIVDPNSAVAVDWLLASRSQSGLSVTVTDTNGIPLDDATVVVVGAGYSEAGLTGRWIRSETSWTEGSFSAQSGNLVTDDTLVLADVGGVYATGSQWLISSTQDYGTPTTTFTTLHWSSTEPNGTSVKFQLAANNDNATWDFVGPDGTASTYFTSTGTAIPTALNGKRYLRYQAFLETTDTDVTPALDDIRISFGSDCLISGQAYFNGLQSATYIVTVTKPGYAQSVTDVIMSGTWQRSSIELTPQ